MIRVLHIFHEMANGGIEHFVMNYYRHIDRTKVQFDFLVSVEAPGYFDDEIERLGGRVYHAYPLKKNPVRNYLDIARIVKQNGYKIVHRHTGSAFGYFDLRAARRSGATHLILHSHNNQAGSRFVHRISKALLKIPCKKLACSNDAGQWLFGADADFTVINNAIDCSKFRFRQEVREQIRQELGLAHKFVVGHVGRFEDQKNHRFILEIFDALQKRIPDSALVLIGNGSLLEETIAASKKLGCHNQVLFLGPQKSPSEHYHAFDVFLLPSKYEGFGITLLEAQTNGLCCYTSDGVVPDSVNVTGQVQFLPLEKSADFWADRIAKKHDRYLIDTAVIEAAGFDIAHNANTLCAYYENLDK